MVVVTDTSPINYLILTGYVDVLPGLHGMDAFRFEQRAGVLLSPSGHGLKLFERRSQLQRLRRELSLFPADRQVVKELLIDIQNALSGQ
jgi:hypothetical protein